MQRWMSCVMSWMLLCAAWVDAQFSITPLFTVPYGTAANQISLAQGSTQTEGDFVDSEYPLLLRRLHTGEFLILSKRKSGLFVQVFNSLGHLQRSWECNESIGDLYSLEVDRKGRLYCLRYLEERDLQNKQLAQPILSIYDSDGKQLSNKNYDKLLLEKLTIIKFEFPILDLVVDKNGAVYIPVSARHNNNKNENVLILIRFSLDSNLIDTLAGLGYPTLTPSGDLGFLNFAPIEIADEQTLRYDGTKVRLLNRDKSVIAEFSLSQDVEVRYPSLSIVPTPNYLVLVDIDSETVINDKQYPLQKRQFVILNRQAHQVFTTEPLVPLGSRRLWDTDESGNIYYLTCTPKGAEIRKINISAR
jgi:hypothetical protein